MRGFGYSYAGEVGLNAKVKIMNKCIMNKCITILLLAFSLAVGGCGPSADSRYDSGYGDGYAVGYNTTCKIRATLVEGDWEDKNYSAGYRAGYSAGAVACRNKDN